MKTIHRSLYFCAVLLLGACVSSQRPPSVVDIPSYREYVNELRERVVTADPASFRPGEQAELSRVSTAIIATLGDANRYSDFADEERDQLIALNDNLHLLIFGENNVRGEERICTVRAKTGTNIPTRSCRTRTQIAQDREAAKRLLEDRSDDIDRNLDVPSQGGLDLPGFN